jgi:prepilin-type N-terminal cleavage/methylation domain-containing protein
MNRRARNPGFTLLELLVVLGILSGFMVMLVQFLDSGITLVAAGEEGQSLADRATAAQAAIELELRALRGPLHELEPGHAPEARMLSQWLPLGLAGNAKPSDPHAQMLRAAVQLPNSVERALLTERLRLEAVAALGDVAAAVIAERVQTQLAATPLLGIGNLLLAPWPQGDAEGAFLELRVAQLLPGQTIEIPPAQQVDPMTVVTPGGADLPSVAVQRLTHVLVDGLLHFELRYWSQATTSWATADLVFDSARAGWIGGEQDAPQFALDRGPESLNDTTDDVYPRAVQVVLVIGRDARFPPEGILADRISSTDQSLHLINPDRFPGALDGGFVKLGAEWLHYGELRDGELRSLQRGQRHTVPARHEAGVPVRVGRTLEFTVPLPHARENWNG